MTMRGGGKAVGMVGITSGGIRTKRARHGNYRTLYIDYSQVPVVFRARFMAGVGI
jgi:hypothetical protein